MDSGAARFSIRGGRLLGQPMRRYGLRDDQRDRIKELLRGREGSVGLTAVDNRLFVEAALCVTGPVFHGVTCRSASAIGRMSIGGSAVWRNPVSGSGCFSIWQPLPTTNAPMVDSTIGGALQRSAGARARGRRLGPGGRSAMRAPVHAAPKVEEASVRGCETDSLDRCGQHDKLSGGAVAVPGA